MPSFVKLTVNLSPRAVAALSEAATREDVTKTDVVNRAIQVYDLLTREISNGFTLLLKDSNGKETKVFIV